MLFQTFRFFFIWSGAWIASLLFPAIISASRSIHNSIILSKLGIQSMTDTRTGNNALAYGVDLSQAKELLADFVPLAYSMIEQELKIIQALSGVILFGAWIAGGGANGFVSWISNSVQGNLNSTVTSGAIATISKNPVIRGVAVGGLVGGPIGAVGSAAYSVLNNLRQSPNVSSFFSQMYPRRKDL